MRISLPHLARGSGMQVGLAVLLLAGLSSCPCRAQEAALLGIYDDPAMTQTHGIMDGTSKVLWLGVRFLGPVPGDGFTGAEFSIAGLQPFSLYTVEFLGDPSVVLGTVAAPADTLNGMGGLSVAWPRCLPDETLLARLTLHAPVPPQNQTLTVRRRYPPSSPLWPVPRLWSCDAPCFGCSIHVVPGTYVLNPLVGSESATWSAVRHLFR